MGWYVGYSSRIMMPYTDCPTTNPHVCLLEDFNKHLRLLNILTPITSVNYCKTCILNFAKIMGCEYSKSHANVQQAKIPKLSTPK